MPRIVVAAFVTAALAVGLYVFLAASADGPDAGASAPAVVEASSDGMGGERAAAPGAQDDEGFEPLIKRRGERYRKDGWNHYGPGYFVLDAETGELESHGGMGLMWYSAEEFDDFELRLEYKTSKPESNSGVFVRVPGVPTSDAYIYHSFEVQIHDTSEQGIHQTGAAYDAEAPTRMAARPTGEWNEMHIRFVGDRLTVVLNGEQVLDWEAEPRGKVEDFAPRGYIGLQNHDHDSSVWFRNIRVKRLSGTS